MPYSKIVTEGNDESPQVLEFAGGELALFSRRCPEKETPNQDGIGVLQVTKDLGVVAVADGCGGMAQGEVASCRALQALHEHLENLKSDLPLRVAIMDGIERANQDVRELGTGAGTTLICVEIDGEYFRPYHVGDSQLVVISNRGRVKLQTVAHSPVGYGVHGGFLSQEEAIHHEDRHLVSNVLGSEDSHIEVGPSRRLAPRDTLVVASDGLFDNLRVPEIADIVRKGKLATVAQRLADEVWQRMHDVSDKFPSKPDDLTFIIYRRARK